MSEKLSLPLPSFDDTAHAFAAHSDSEMRKIWWLFAAMNQPWLVKTGSPILGAALQAGLPIKGLIKNTIYQHFCGGESIADSVKTVQALGKYNIGTILDYSVEGEKTEAGFDETAKEIIASIRKAAVAAHIPFTVFKVTGLARFALLEKIQAGEVLTVKEQEEFKRAEARVEKICQEAAKMEVRIFFDGEETWIQDVIDRLAFEMMRKYNRENCIVFNTWQIYRKAGLKNLMDAWEEARDTGYMLGAKLVRGAYMEKERARAKLLQYPDPIQDTKEITDADYNRALIFCLDHLDDIAFCAGTHNEKSSLLLVHEMEKRKIDRNDNHIWFSQLLGMSDNISYNLAHAGYNVAKYVPYGPVEAVMPYLMRRAQENTSVAGQSSREFKLISKEIERRKKG